MSPELSVVVPMYDEEDVLPLLVERLRPVLDALGATYEVLAVDDGSRDATPVLLQRLPPRVAAAAGRAAARQRRAPGRASRPASPAPAATASSPSTPTCRTRPRSSPRCWRWPARDGVDVVYGVRTDRSTDSAFKRARARAFYRLIRRLSRHDTRRPTPATSG